MSAAPRRLPQPPEGDSGWKRTGGAAYSRIVRRGDMIVTARVMHSAKEEWSAYVGMVQADQRAPSDAWLDAVYQTAPAAMGACDEAMEGMVETLMFCLGARGEAPECGSPAPRGKQGRIPEMIDLINDDTRPVRADLIQSTSFNSGARAGFAAARAGGEPVIPEPARVGLDRDVWRRGFRCGWKEGQE